MGFFIFVIIAVILIVVGALLGAFVGIAAPFTYVFRMYIAVESEVLGKDLTYSPKVWLIVFAIIFLTMLTHSAPQIIGSANLLASFATVFISGIFYGMSFKGMLITLIILMVVGALIGVNFACQDKNLCGTLDWNEDLVGDIIGTIFASLHAALLVNYHMIMMGIYKVNGSWDEINDVTEQIKVFHDTGVRANIVGIAVGVIVLAIGIIRAVSMNGKASKKAVVKEN